MAASEATADVTSRLMRASFEVSPEASRVTARRQRSLPSRGLFRLFIPRFVCVVRTDDEPPSTHVRPDGIAIFMAIVCLGNLVVELTMDRAKYPREVPPAFVYGVSLVYFVLFVVEWRMSRAALDRALARG